MTKSPPAPSAKMPGGVCAVLDYEVEVMAEYVAEMTTRLTSDSAIAPVAFRKFISQILSSTRLPSTTILLGMNYFAKRINLMHFTHPGHKMSEGQVWRMLTVALLLGSKFLDDNTFQNRSWAEVSGIPVRELNTLEFEWMAAIEWQLYVNLDRSEDYNAWLKNWQDWSDSKKRHQAVAVRERLAPISPVHITDSEMARIHNDPALYSAWHQQQVAEYERYERLSSLKRNEQAQAPAPAQIQTRVPAYRPREASWAAYSAQAVAWPNSAKTPPDSGYGTPDFVNSATSINAQYNNWFAQHAQQTNRAIAGQSSVRQQPFQQPANYSTYHSQPHSGYPYTLYGHNIWDHNPANCGCANCTTSAAHKPQPYFGMVQSFGQPVVG